MDLSPDELPVGGYEPLEVLQHDQLIPFVQRALKHRTRATVAYWVANALAFGWLVAAVLVAEQPVGDVLDRAFLGVAAALLLVPVHEGLHALAYRLLGARRTSFDMNLRRLYFMALADRFVADAREFRIVALAPFVVISTAVLVAIILGPPGWTIFLLGLLFAHTALCSGDFAMVSYLEHHRGDVVTFDDRARRLTEFWRRAKAT